MAEQATGAVEQAEGAGSLAHGSAHELEHNPGKPMSWAAIAVIVVGFIVGGVAMVPTPHWWLFWLGVGIAVVGCVMTLFAKTFTDDWY